MCNDPGDIHHHKECSVLKGAEEHPSGARIIEVVDFVSKTELLFVYSDGTEELQVMDELKCKLMVNSLLEHMYDIKAKGKQTAVLKVWGQEVLLLTRQWCAKENWLHIEHLAPTLK